MYKLTRLQVLIVGGLALIVLSSGACTPAQEQEATNLFDNAVSALESNRTIAAQCVSDVKSTIPEDDPKYKQLMKDYDSLRDANNAYLLAVADALHTGNGAPLNKVLTEGVKQRSSQFFSEATRELNPARDTKGYDTDHALIFPSEWEGLIETANPQTRKIIEILIRHHLLWRPSSQL
jgi:hypothetical protein